MINDFFKNSIPRPSRTNKFSKKSILYYIYSGTLLLKRFCTVEYEEICTFNLVRWYKMCVFTKSFHFH